jgi:hypothetical protein
MNSIDRISHNGDICEHLTDDGDRTLCGLDLNTTQPASGNRSCRRCEKIAARRQEQLKPELITITLTLTPREAVLLRDYLEGIPLYSKHREQYLEMMSGLDVVFNGLVNAVHTWAAGQQPQT